MAIPIRDINALRKDELDVYSVAGIVPTVDRQALVLAAGGRSCYRISGHLATERMRRSETVTLWAARLEREEDRRHPGEQQGCCPYLIDDRMQRSPWLGS